MGKATKTTGKKNQQVESFDFEDALSISEFFEAKGLEGNERTWDVRTAKAGFLFLALSNGETTEDGKRSVSCFRLSNKLQDEVELSKDWVRENRESIRLIEGEDLHDEDGNELKFGVIYLVNGTFEVWED